MNEKLHADNIEWFDRCDTCGAAVGEDNLAPNEQSQDTGECYCVDCLKIQDKEPTT